ncbi:DUF1566 domain-containing protein [Variovorax sp. DAIF25]|uniref:DUF1566 domain-containing protein n=1 Tax=Variovorax sp. DAIF25 TaxID=3080983 RepID=UPI003D6BF355
MSNVTLEAVRARQSELAAMIEQLQAQSTATVVQVLPETKIELRAGEIYAGAVLDEAGNVKHHLVLILKRPDDRMPWDDAMKWAASIGGTLPDRQEQALLFANCKPHLEGAWHWSCQEHEDDASYAWCCGFTHGLQTTTRKSYEGCAVAVRRL